MSRPSLAPPLLLLLALGAMRAAEPAPTLSALSAPAAPPASSAISAGTAAKLVAARPKLPPLVQPAAPKPAEETPDLRETDKPRNGIVRLPKYVVRETRPPVFREQDIYTQSAFSRRLAKRYYSEGYLAFSRLIGYTPLAFIFPSAEASAMAQFREEERLRIKAEFSDYTNMLMISNPAAGEKLKGDVQQTFMRWSEMGWSNKSK